MIQPNITNRLIPGHFGKGRYGGYPWIIVIHVQEGTNDLPSFFASSGDDSTIWCKQDGTLVRMIYDTDAAWTNGYTTEPIAHDNPNVQKLYNAGVRNTNNYALTIENQGFAAKGFTDAQIESNAIMCAYWMQKYGWTDVDFRIVRHADVGEHKGCPGPLYPMARLKARVKQLLAQNPATSGVAAGNGIEDIVVLNGFMLGHGMLAYWKKFVMEATPHPLGLPISNERDYTAPDGKKYVVQGFERAVLGYDGSVADPNYRVQGLLIGDEWLKEHVK
jgi:hypothetical protein